MMGVPVDILLDEDLDVAIVNGDFCLGDATYQNQKILLLAEQNSFKQYPTATVGMFTYLHDDSVADLNRQIRLKFTKDGMKVRTIGRTKDGKLEILAPYENY